MFFQQIYEKGLSQYSYFIGCQENKSAIVIDPKRDIETYLQIAEREGYKISHIAETHIHADFLSGSRELAAETGAEILLSDEGGADWQYLFTHKGLKDGDTFWIGNIKFSVLHTPGHTPEHISFLVTDTKASKEPLLVLTGDFVFVGDVGRPDLLERAAGFNGTMVTSARELFYSLKKFKTLKDYIQIFPAHGAGSACGKSLGAIPSSTVGYEKRVNWAFQVADEDEFIEKLLEGQPEPPKYFAMMKNLNKTGPAVLGNIPHPAKLSFRQFNKALEDKITLIDTRDKLAFAGGHIKGSINIQDNNSFTNWTGWILDYKNPFMLIASENRIEEITKKLVRIGLDNIYGYITGVEKWAESENYECEILTQITVDELKNSLDDDNILVLDVRNKKEFEEGHIENAKHIFAGYIPDKLIEIPRDKKIVVHCASGDRSSIAASILLKNGIKNIANLTGSINAWIQAEYPLVHEGVEV